MEWLQDALEDAQYLVALTSGRMEPIRSWPEIPQVEVEKYIAEIKSIDPDALSLDTICQQQLGFYLFVKFLARIDKQDVANFLIESASLQANKSSNSVKLLLKFVKNYLLSESPSSPKINSPTSPSASKLIGTPSAANLFPFSLSRSKYSPVTPESSASDSVRIHSRPDQTIFITGPVVTKLLNKLRICDGARSQLIKRESLNNENHYHELAKLENLIFQLIKEQYYSLFIESKEFYKFNEMKIIFQNHFQLKESEFDCFRVLGRGGFGRVYACRSALTGKLYGLKMMNKKRIKLKKAMKMCLAEREIMEIIGSPYIVSLKYAFQNTEHLCLVMDLMIGGDLSYHLNERNFTIEETKYYSVRIIMALMTLHENGYVYRDLKPENVLLDAEGQSKISDLGLVAKIDENSKGLSMICGTRGYWAPEILLVDPKKSDSFYSFEVDWFSLGCCMYEFVMGISPFRTEEAYNWRKGSRANSNPNSINGKDIVAIPFLQSKEGNNYSLDCALLEMEPDLSEVRDTILRDLIRRLLEKDPKKRLGYNRNFQEIMSHEFFHDIQWNAVHTMIPPFKPSLKPNTVLASEVGEFSDEKEVKKVDWEYKDEELFKHWQYLSLSGMQEEFVEFLINQEHHQSANQAKNSQQLGTCSSCCNIM